MTYYPTMFTIEHKDSKLNMKLNIKVKLIELIDYKCSKCKKVGSLKGWEEYTKDKLNKSYSRWEYIKTSRFPREVVNKQGKLLCIDCKKELEEKPKKRVKLYYSQHHPFINTFNLINQSTVHRWKYAIYNPIRFMSDIYCIEESLEKAYKHLKESAPIKNLKITTHKRITMKELEKYFKEYKKRKFIKDL